MWLSVLKPLWCFWKASSKSNSTCLFDLEVALRYTLFQRAPEISQRFVLSPYKKRDIKLIKNIGYVKLHGKHCRIRNNVKPFLRCVWLTRWLRQQGICLQCRRSDFDLWVRNIPWRREWLPIPVFWPGKFHGATFTSLLSSHVWHTAVLDPLRLQDTPGSSSLTSVV